MPSRASTESPVDRVLAEAQAGDRAALDELYSLVYAELRVLARRHRRRWDANGTLNTTALVHEAYLKLAKQRDLHLQTRGEFFALAATAIRHIVSNYARDRRARKRGSGQRPVSLDDMTPRADERCLTDAQIEFLVAIDEALNRLERTSSRQRGVVECRFFGGMSVEETAEAMGISPRTVKRDWTLAQAWLQRELHPL